MTHLLTSYLNRHGMGQVPCWREYRVGALRWRYTIDCASSRGQKLIVIVVVQQPCPMSEWGIT